MKTKIAIGLESPLKLRGGVSVLVETLIMGLHEDFEIYLLSQDRGMEDLPAACRPRVKKHFPWVTMAKFGSPAYVKLQDQAVQWMVENSISILHLHCGNYGWGNRYPYASLARRAAHAGISVVWTDHLIVSPTSGICGENKPGWFKLLLLPLAWSGKMDQLRNVKAEIAVSDHDLRKLQSWYWPLRRRLKRIYHSRLPESEQTSRISNGHREKVILNVGHIAMRKGQHLLAQAFADISNNHPDWSLWLAGHDSGDGCYREIERIRCQYGLDHRVVLLGDQQDIPSLMRRASIYVQPSIWEALGLALQEALFYGCPAIGSKAGGIPELIDEGKNGFLVEAGSVSALREKLHLLISDDELRNKLASNSTESILAKKMTMAAMLGEMACVYRNLQAPAVS